LKKVIFYYLASFNVINYFSILLFGSDSAGSSFIHPGVIIKGLISSLLLFWYLTNKSNLKSSYYKLGLPLIIFLILVYHPIQSYVNYSLPGFIFEYNQGFKITTFILIIFFIADNKKYFIERFNIIMLINTLVVTMNLYLAYFFNFGKTTMYHDLGYYKGFLGGNSVSVALIIIFAFLLYSFNKSRVYKILFFMNLFNFYILGTKSVYFIVPVLIIFLLNEIRTNSNKLFIYPLAIGCLSIVFVLSSLDDKAKKIYDDRIGYHYNHEYNKLLTKGHIYNNPILYTLESITSGPRLYRAVNITSQISSSDSWIILFGHGAKDQRVNIPASKMDPVDITYKYGLFGLLLIYGVIFVISKLIIFNKKTDLISTVILCISIYSTLGGFVMGTGDIGIFFGFFLGLSYPLKRIYS